MSVWRLQGRCGHQLITLTSFVECLVTVTEYTLEFQTIVARSEWNEPALKMLFPNRLNLEVVTGLACCDDQLTLDSLIDLAIRLDRHLRATLQWVVRDVSQGHMPLQSPYSWGASGSVRRRERVTIKSLAVFTVEKMTISYGSALSSLVGTPGRAGTPDPTPKGWVHSS